MSNRTRGRGLVLHFDGSHWILRERRSRQQMSLYPVVIFHRRKIAFIMHVGSLTRDFLLVKTSFPMGFAVGINFENFTQRKILACGCNKIQRLRCFRIKTEVWLVVCFALNSWRRESHCGSGNRDEIMVSFPELKTFN